MNKRPIITKTVYQPNRNLKQKELKTVDQLNQENALAQEKIIKVKNIMIADITKQHPNEKLILQPTIKTKDIKHTTEVNQEKTLILIPINKNNEPTYKRWETTGYLLISGVCPHGTHLYSASSQKDLDVKSIPYIFEKDYGVTYPIVCSQNIKYCKICESLEPKIIQKSEPRGKLCFYATGVENAYYQHANIPKDVDQSSHYTIINDDVWINMTHEHNTLSTIDELKDKVIMVSGRRNFLYVHYLQGKYESLTKQFYDFGSLVQVMLDGYETPACIVDPCVDDDDYPCESEDIIDNISDHLKVNEITYIEKNKNDKVEVMENDKLTITASELESSISNAINEIETLDVANDITTNNNSNVDKSSNDMIPITDLDDSVDNIDDNVSDKNEHLSSNPFLDDNMVSSIKYISQSSSSSNLTPIPVKHTGFSTPELGNQNEFRSLIIPMKTPSDFYDNIAYFKQFYNVDVAVAQYGNHRLSVNFNNYIETCNKIELMTSLEAMRYKIIEEKDILICIDGNVIQKWSIVIEDSFFDKNSDINLPLDKVIEDKISNCMSVNIQPIVLMLEKAYLDNNDSHDRKTIIFNLKHQSKCQNICTRDLRMYFRSSFYRQYSEQDDIYSNDEMMLDLLIALKYSPTIPYASIIFKKDSITITCGNALC